MTSIYDFDKLAKLLNSLYLLTGRKITLKDKAISTTSSPAIPPASSADSSRAHRSATRNAWPAIQRRWPMRNCRTRRISTDVMPD